jgi:GTP-binding protein YchF
MGLSAGIVGLPNVGKSTIFNALCRGRAAVENYPFCTVEPNVGVAVVPDERLGRITALIETRKVVPAFIELVDIAGLVRGASRGAGLGNQFLGHIRTVDAIVHIVRCFQDRDVVHVEGSVDPLRDVTTVETELLLKDLDTVERAIERAAEAAASGESGQQVKVAAFEKARAALAEGTPLRSVFGGADEVLPLAQLQLLTLKPVLYVANVDEDGLERDGELVAALREFALCEGAPCVKLCGKIEAEIAALDESDRTDFLQSMGLAEPGLNVLSRGVYRLLDLQTFFTAQPAESRAWTIPSGTVAATAAAMIQSDRERGFIGAEVFTVEDLERHGSEVALRSAGRIRQEGPGYVMQEGDVIRFRFDV